MFEYNLSSIPGFNDFIKNGDIDTEQEKYYSVKHYTTKENEKYDIVKYNKDLLSSDLIPTYGLLRSVILFGSQIIGFAPPKSMSGENFITKYPTKTDLIQAQEFIEGTMINLFFDSINCVWQISTRNTVGAEVSFYKESRKESRKESCNNSNNSNNSNKTFYQMFMETCTLNSINFETLNPKYCYSFVLQYPDNRIVVPFKNAQLYLVAVYEIIQKENNIVVIEIDLNNLMAEQSWRLTSVRFPMTYEFTTYTELISTFASPNTPYDILGIIVKNVETGERTKFRNPIYEEVRQLKGNQPKLQYQYLCLRHSGKLPEFLKYYPETKTEMSNFRDQVHMFTNTLHQNYISCFVKKEMPLNNYPVQYKTHMFKIHEIFKNDLRPNQLFVTNTVVINYINKLHPSLLMYCLNHHLRKRMVDTIKSNTDI